MRQFQYQKQLPKACILKQVWAGRSGWHWCAYYDGTVYCPDKGAYPFATAEANSNGGKFTSYLSFSK